MTFIGYEVRTKRHKCYDLETWKVQINLHVIFEKKRQWI